MRYETPAPPAELGEVDGLAYSLWLPDGEPWAGVVILHGAGSCKENHHDFARAARSRRALGGLLRPARARRQPGRARRPRARPTWPPSRRCSGDVPLATRGSSMGGYLAILAAEQLRARAAVAICPASADGLARGLRDRAFDFRADAASLEAFLLSNEVDAAVERLALPLLLLHAEGDERVPVAHSREPARLAPDPRERARRGRWRRPPLDPA